LANDNSSVSAQAADPVARRGAVAVILKSNSPENGSGPGNMVKPLTQFDF
jgi:hypothetical protein